MTVRQQWSVVLGVIAVLGIGLLVLVHALGDEIFPVGVGSRAPAFSAHVLGSATQTKTLADYQGQVMIVNIWATWCEPCKVEMPSLEQLYKLYGPSGLKVVAVSIDETASDDSIRAYARNMGLTFEILHDKTGEMEKAYQTTGYPESFVVARDGVIRKKWIGPDDWASQGNIALTRNLLGLPPAGVDGDSALSAPLRHPRALSSVLRRRATKLRRRCWKDPRSRPPCGHS